MQVTSFGGLCEQITIDPEWDEQIAQISSWLRATKQIAFTPRSGKAFITHPKPLQRRRKPRG